MTCKYGIAVFLACLLAVQAGYAQFRGNDVSIVARELSAQADRLWLLARDRDLERNARAIELYMALSNLANSSRVYADVAGRYRNENVLRAGARSLVDQTQLIDAHMDRSNMSALDYLRNDWQRTRDLVANLSDRLNVSYAFRSDVPLDRRPRELPRTDYGLDRDSIDMRPSSYRSGSFRWQGQVDGTDYIKLKGTQVTTAHLSANPIQDARYSLQSMLPRVPVNVRLIRLRGRGRIALVETPSQLNDYTAVVLVEDPEGGPDFYEFELAW